MSEKEDKSAEVNVPVDATDDTKVVVETTDATETDAVVKKPNNVEEDSQISKLEKSIIRQINYYFGDANLSRDKFLLEQIGKDKDGWVPFTVLLTFKRLADLSTDVSVIVNSLLKDDEGLVEISEDRQKVRRHPECPVPEQNEERRKEIMSRTAYAKGFPLETTISELIEYFAPLEKVQNINMRKYLDKPTKSYKSKGSVFLTFEKKEQMHEWVAKDKVMYQDREVLRKRQEQYLVDKREEMAAKKDAKNKSKEKPVELKFSLPKGSVVFFENAPETVTRELLRESVAKVDGTWDIAYVDYTKGDAVGYIRFQEENIAAKFLEKLANNTLKLNDDVELILRTLTEDEETVFLDKAISQMKSQRNNVKNKKGGAYNNRRKRGNNETRNDEKRKKTFD